MVTSRNFHEAPQAGESILPSILPLLTDVSVSLAHALAALDETPEGFRILVDSHGRLEGILDARRLHAALLELHDLNAPLARANIPFPSFLRTDSPVQDAVRTLMESDDTAVPVCDPDGRVINAVPREAFQQWLEEDLPWDPRMDFMALRREARPQDAVFRPWGFYRVLARNEFSQTKILALDPGQEISLQKHFLREEYWTVVRGEGVFRLGGEVFPVSRGFTARIPREALHWIRNTSTGDRLVIMEVQTGDAFREDDIVRIADRYQRD